MTLLVAVATLVVAWNQLSNIRKQSELAAAQAVINTYYRARDGIFLTIHRNFRDGMEMVLFEERLSEASPSPSEKRDKLLERGQELIVYGRDLADSDYLNIVHHLCQQSKQGLLGPTAQSFLEEVVYNDLEVFKPDDREADYNRTLTKCAHLKKIQ